MHLSVRAYGDPIMLVRAVEGEIHALDRELCAVAERTHEIGVRVALGAGQLRSCAPRRARRSDRRFAI